MRTELYSNDQIKENDVDGACSTYRSVKNYIQVLVGKPKERRLLEDLGIDGRITS